MAVKTSQIIYDVREILNEYSDDGLYDDRYILYLYDLIYNLQVCNINKLEFL